MMEDLTLSGNTQENKPVYEIYTGEVKEVELELVILPEEKTPFYELVF